MTVRYTDDMDSVYVQVGVILEDVNDNVPQFLQEAYSFSISKAVPPGYDIGLVNVVDIDISSNAEISYEILTVNNSGAYFTIDYDTGVITVVTGLDYEYVSSYTLQVIAYDLGNPSLTAATNVQIMITDENDNAPVFSHETFMFEIKENVPPGWKNCCN